VAVGNPNPILVKVQGVLLLASYQPSLAMTVILGLLQPYRHSYRMVFTTRYRPTQPILTARALTSLVIRPVVSSIWSIARERRSASFVYLLTSRAPILPLALALRKFARFQQVRGSGFPFPGTSDPPTQAMRQCQLLRQAARRRAPRSRCVVVSPGPMRPLEFWEILRGCARWPW